MRLRLRLEFDGSGFSGWQLQPEEKTPAERPTIQAVVEGALSTFLHFGARRLPLIACGRTDAGVHAEEFFCHVDVPEECTRAGGPAADVERLRHGLNCILPEGVAITSAGEVGEDFHAQKGVTSKIYEYSVLLRRSKAVLMRGRCLWLPIDPAGQGLDREKLRAGMKMLEGTHDFVAFAAANFTAKTSVRSLHRCSLTEEAAGAEAASGLLLRMHFEGDGFLKQMVRNMAGTLIELATAKRDLESLKRLLDPAAHGTGRQHAGFCAPAEGLCLKRVFYARG